MNRLLIIALATLLLVGSNSLAECEERPFQAASSGLLGFAQQYEIGGQATHLGHFGGSLRVRHTAEIFFRILLDLFRDDPAARTSTAFFVAADGSTLEGTIRYDTFDAESLTATAEISITGGTGRFANAGGTFDVLLAFETERLGSCEVLMDGTIDY